MKRLASMILRVVALYRQPEYFRQLLALAMPIALQQFAFAALNMVGFVMIGQKGDAAMAAVGAAGQVGFLLAVILFGLVSGAAMVAAQLWGQQDVASIIIVMSFGLQITDEEIRNHIPGEYAGESLQEDKPHGLLLEDFPGFLPGEAELTNVFHPFELRFGFAARQVSNTEEDDQSHEDA